MTKLFLCAVGALPEVGRAVRPCLFAPEFSNCGMWRGHTQQQSTAPIASGARYWTSATIVSVAWNLVPMEPFIYCLEAY